MGNNNLVRDVIVADIFAGFCLWWLLVCCKLTGGVAINWALVLSGLVWIPWALFMLTAFPMLLIAYLKRICRRKKNDRRIIRQAKACCAWDKRPTPLGGRALELKAWEDYKIRRKPGESDKCLRRRCMNTADNEYTKGRW